MLKGAEKAGIEGIKAKRNPLLISPADFFTMSEVLRKEFAKLLKINESNRIALIPSVSYGIANAMHNIRLSSGDEVVVMGEQFPSNYYSWQRLCQGTGATLKTVAAPETRVNRGKEWNARILEAITPATRVVAMGNVHWADGTLFNLKEIRKRTLEVGALLIIDGTQSVGALAFDMKSIQPDALIVAGYKWLLGPYSIGFAYYGPYFDNGVPIEENWINRLHSEDFASLINYESEYQAGALRYEVGEHSNFILVPMMLASLKQINAWGPKNIQEYCDKISKKAVSMLRENGFWIEDDKFRARHLFGVRIPADKDIKKVKDKLKRNKISVSYRGDAIRVAPNVYNQEKELMKLTSILLSK